jgi:hypothetical protein
MARKPTAAERKAQARRQAEINALLRGPSMQDLMRAIAERQAQARAQFAAQMRQTPSEPIRDSLARSATGPVSDSIEPPKCM